MQQTTQLLLFLVLSHYFPFVVPHSKFNWHFSVCQIPSVLWHCWLGVRQIIQPVKIEWWGVHVVICLQWGADCLHMVQLTPLPSPSSPASFKSRLVLPFWYGLTQVVLEEAVNGCSSSSSVYSTISTLIYFLWYLTSDAEIHSLSQQHY